MSPTRNTKEIKQLLGLDRYYNKLMLCFVDIATPLTSLTKQVVSFDWIEPCQEAFLF